MPVRRRVRIVNGSLATSDAVLRERLEEYGEFLQGIGQEHVQSTIANTLAAMKNP